VADPAVDSAAVSLGPKRGQGRPRSSASHAAIQRATLELLQESGFGSLTIEAIAARAGASKATIYRWWPNKASVAMEAFITQIVPALPFENTGHLHEDFRKHLRTMVTVLGSPLGRTLAEIIAEMQHDPDLASAFREQYVVPRRRAPREALQQAVERGELPAGSNPDIIMDALYGAIYFSLLIRTHEIDQAFVDGLIDQILTPGAA
jgi:AcrR family transcriptional regulator